MFKKEHIPYRDLVLTAIVFGLIYWFYPEILILIALVSFLLIGAFLKSVRILNHKMWAGITEMMSRIFPPIFLTLIFFVVLVPFGLLFKLFTKSKPKNSTSNFITIEEQIDLSFFERVW